MTPQTSFIRSDYTEILRRAAHAAEFGAVAIKERRESVDRLETEIRERFTKIASDGDTVTVDSRELALWIRENVGTMRTPRTA